eukprot:1366509-Amorphochlora_amoeboformis.AAC.1
MHAGFPEAAKGVFYRAFHQCPWSKLLWLDGIDLLRKAEDSTPESELTDLINTMVEKEIRLHVVPNADDPREGLELEDA